jgi:type IV secretory pathway VirB10-like protein
MSSRILAGVLALGCVTAAAGGAYVAVRQSAATPVPVAAAPVAPSEPEARPVAETEAVIGGTAPARPSEAEAPASAAPAPAGRLTPEREAPRSTSPVVRREPSARPAQDRQIAARPAPLPAPASAPVADRSAATPSVATPQIEPAQEAARTPEPAPAPPVPQFEEVVLPTSSVMGLEVDTPLSSEQARLEDRVDARVTRDVVASGRVAIPAGSRVIGAVTVVERGGKVKQTARLGVRFHTLVLADGREIPLHTEPVYREGESPAGESARKIGGAAIGGAILGAIIGGGKGAVIGGATGAAGGSAVVMAGDRNAATLAPGTVVTVRLSAPATIDVEKREPQQH